MNVKQIFRRKRNISMMLTILFASLTLLIDGDSTGVNWILLRDEPAIAALFACGALVSGAAWWKQEKLLRLTNFF
ncbi:MAG TPA: hypothetical protein ENJ29_07495 [Bacteroidetes bacterium]|nr:hypothetical protein [Bacteroidota bacterium]